MQLDSTETRFLYFFFFALGGLQAPPANMHGAATPLSLPKLLLLLRTCVRDVTFGEYQTCQREKLIAVIRFVTAFRSRFGEGRLVGRSYKMRDTRMQ